MKNTRYPNKKLLAPVNILGMGLAFIIVYSSFMFDFNRAIDNNIYARLIIQHHSKLNIGKNSFTLYLLEKLR